MKKEQEVEEDKKAKFLKIYANVPDALREDIIAIIDKKPYNWNTAFFEIANNSNLGQKILKALQELGII